MRITRSIVLALAPLISSNAGATVIWHTTTVKAIYPYAGGNHFVLAFGDDHPSCTNTQTPDKYYYVQSGVNSVTADDVKAFYALAMFAMAQGKQFTFLFDDATTNCYISAMKVTD